MIKFLKNIYKYFIIIKINKKFLKIKNKFSFKYKFNF